MRNFNANKCILSDNVEIVQTLIKAGADVNADGEDLFKPIHMACQNGNFHTNHHSMSHEL